MKAESLTRSRAIYLINDSIDNFMFSHACYCTSNMESLTEEDKELYEQGVKMFEDEFSALQADIVDICNEYSKGLADKIFIYAANEGMILAHHFYCINNKVLDCQELNKSELNIEFDVSDDCQEQVLDILNEDIQKIQSICEKYKQPVPKLIKLVYEPKTKKFNADYKYDNQTTDDISVFDNDDKWFEEEKAKLEGGNAVPTGKYKA